MRRMRGSEFCTDSQIPRLCFKRMQLQLTFPIDMGAVVFQFISAAPLWFYMGSERVPELWTSTALTLFNVSEMV